MFRKPIFLNYCRFYFLNFQASSQVFSKIHFEFPITQSEVSWLKPTQTRKPPLQISTFRNGQNCKQLKTKDSLSSIHLWHLRSPINKFSIVMHNRQIKKAKNMKKIKSFFILKSGTSAPIYYSFVGQKFTLFRLSFQLIIEKWKFRKFLF